MISLVVLLTTIGFKTLGVSLDFSQENTVMDNTNRPIWNFIAVACWFLTKMMKMHYEWLRWSCQFKHGRI